MSDQEGENWLHQLVERLEEIAWDLRDRYDALSKEEKFAVKAFGTLAAGNVALKMRRRAMTKKIFIAFAGEDEWARRDLVGQGKNSRTPIDFKDMSIPKPFDSKWKTQCRDVIKGCDGLVALLSTHTRAAEGARWEMQCANDEAIPMIGVHTQKDNKGAIPTELAGKKVIEWTWDGIADWINSL